MWKHILNSQNFRNVKGNEKKNKFDGLCESAIKKE